MPTSDSFFQHVALTDLTLRVGDLAAVAAFYHETLGFREVATQGTQLALSANGSAPALIVLDAAPAAPRRRAGAAGLFHTALRYPDRAALGRAVRHLRERGVALGAADHGVSEAIYLQDPEGNGVELYADRPAEAWPQGGAADQVAMFTAPLDLDALLAAATPSTDPLLPANTRIGHIHLSVSQLPPARVFYADVLGFPVRQQDLAGALFFGRDGYHHHLAANTWRSQRPMAPGSQGLARFTIRFRDADERRRVMERARHAGRLTGEKNDSATVHDPDEMEIVLSG